MSKRAYSIHVQNITAHTYDTKDIDTINTETNLKTKLKDIATDKMRMSSLALS